MPQRSHPHLYPDGMLTLTPTIRVETMIKMDIYPSGRPRQFFPPTGMHDSPRPTRPEHAYYRRSGPPPDLLRPRRPRAALELRTAVPAYVGQHDLGKP